MESIPNLYTFYVDSLSLIVHWTNAWSIFMGMASIGEPFSLQWWSNFDMALQREGCVVLGISLKWHLNLGSFDHLAPCGCDRAVRKTSKSKLMWFDTYRPESLLVYHFDLDWDAGFLSQVRCPTLHITFCASSWMKCFPDEFKWLEWDNVQTSQTTLQTTKNEFIYSFWIHVPKNDS